MPSPTTLRSGASPLDTSQVVNVVPEQVLKDQLPRNLDDALVNVSGITQANTLAGTQDAVMRRGFGDNRDGSIMRNGMPLVQGRSLNPAVESVEVLKGPASLFTASWIPAASSTRSASARSSISTDRSRCSARPTPTTRAVQMGPSTSPGRSETTVWPIASSAMASARTIGAISAATAKCWLRRRWPGMATTRRFSSATSIANSSIRSTAARPSIRTPRRRLRFRRRAGSTSPSTTCGAQSDLMQASVEQRLNDDWKLYAAYSYNTETFSANQLRITVSRCQDRHREAQQ